MQFCIASKAQEFNTIIIKSNVKNLMGSYISKIFLIVYAMDQILNNKKKKNLSTNSTIYKRSKHGKVKTGIQNAADLVLKINYQFLKKYKCKPVKHVYILKSNSSNFKPLSIPTILDHTIQKMFQLVINPAVDVFTDPNSYGFRKHRSYHNAIGFIAKKIIKASKNLTVTNIDIEKFFDTINHK
jgi:retron-type reverse transcriptase